MLGVNLAWLLHTSLCLASIIRDKLCTVKNTTHAETAVALFQHSSQQCKNQLCSILEAAVQVTNGVYVCSMMCVHGRCCGHLTLMQW